MEMIKCLVNSENRVDIDYIIRNFDKLKNSITCYENANIYLLNYQFRANIESVQISKAQAYELIKALSLIEVKDSIISVSYMRIIRVKYLLKCLDTCKPTLGNTYARNAYNNVILNKQ